jgi:hypothetical protein
VAAWCKPDVKNCLFLYRNWHFFMRRLPAGLLVALGASAGSKVILISRRPLA